MGKGCVFSIAAAEDGSEYFEGAGAVAGGDCIGQFIEGSLLSGENHGFYVAQGDTLFLADVEDEFFEFVRNHHHVAAERIDQFTGGVQIDLYVASDAIFLDPTDSIAFLHASQFDDCAVAAKSFANALIALFVGEIHAACVDRNADVIGDEDQHRVGIWITTILLDGIKFFFIRPTTEKSLHTANKKYLKWCHQRRSTSAIKNFRQVSFR